MQKWSPVVPLVKQTMLRSSGFGGCWGHESSIIRAACSLLKLIKIDYMDILETYNWLLKIILPQSLRRNKKQKKTHNRVCASSKRNSCKYRFKQKNKTSRASDESAGTTCLCSVCRYLHILHGHDVHPTLGSSVDQLGVERVHDDDGFEDEALAFLPVLQQHFCLLLIVTQHCGDLRWGGERNSES